MTPFRPALRYHGGKWRLSPWIISHFPYHEIYVEPFGGAASVLLRKPRSTSEIWNDLSDDLFTMFCVLREPQLRESLLEALALTPYSRRDFDLSYDPAPDGDSVERTRRYIVRSFFGYGSKSCADHSRNGFRSFRGGGDKTPAHDWTTYPNALAVIAERMAGVVIEHKPAVDVIRRYDRPEALIYCDPPYVHGTRNLNHGTYLHEMSQEDHVALADALHQCAGQVAISGYDCPLYQELYGSWRMVSRRAYADMASARTECLWLSPNFRIPESAGRISTKKGGAL
jgi:DNA adenine methylase